MSFGIVAQVPKNFARDLQRYVKVSESATLTAVRQETNRLKQGLRDDIKAAGLGGRVANTWRSRVYPEKGGSLDAAGFLWSRAPHIIRGFDDGATIVPNAGKFLAIPTDNVPRRGGYRGGRLTPKKWPSRLGELKIIKTRRGQLLLVVERQASFARDTGQLRGFRKPSAKSLRTGNRLTTVVMFVLVPKVKLKKKFDVKKQVQHALRRLPDTMFREKQKRRLR